MPLLTSIQQSSDEEPLLLGDGLSRDFLLHHHLCPRTRRADGVIVIALAPDAVRDATDDIALAYRAPVITEDASSDEVDRLIERLTSRGGSELELLERRVGDDADDDDDDFTADVRNLATQPPVVRWVSFIVREAFEAGASDVHLEAIREGLAVRFRIDGVLVPASDPPPGLQHAIVSRIKLLAELDIAERRKPQDGRIRVRLEARELDLRVSTVPTMLGESVVLRLLHRGERPIQLAELGMRDDTLSSVTSLAARPHGMCLVTGPTGSGKTTTLYACLARRDAQREKVITIEDPIEYELAGVTQVPINAQAGVTFATALRSILRQDPDILMVGEMRDRETAEIATQSAMTGHLVFTTLHASDAVGAIPRLLDLGIPSYLVAATLDGVIAQRLVRRICDACHEEYVPDRRQLQSFSGVSAEPVVAQRGRGCPACRGTGYRGRLGLFELLLLDDELRDAIVGRKSRSTLDTLALSAGMRTLRDDGWSKVAAGLTTIDEVLRVATT